MIIALLFSWLSWFGVGPNPALDRGGRPSAPAATHARGDGDWSGPARYEGVADISNGF
jgi:hypothetical protein